VTIFEAFVTLTAQEEETMIFSKYVGQDVSECGADPFTYLQLAPAKTRIVQIDSETNRENRRPSCAEQNTRNVLRIIPQRLERELFWPCDFAIHLTSSLRTERFATERSPQDADRDRLLAGKGRRT
jgi:hypothetical protein